MRFAWLGGLGCLLALAGGAAVRALAQNGAGAGEIGWGPIIDESSPVHGAKGSEGRITVADLDPGLPSAQEIPPCIGSRQPGQAARCATVCVSLPDYAKAIDIRASIADIPEMIPSGSDIPSCGLDRCVGTTSAQAKMLIEAPDSKPIGPNNRICVVAKNWNTERTRRVFLAAMYDTQGYPIQLVSARVLIDAVSSVEVSDTSKRVLAAVYGSRPSLERLLRNMEVQLWVLRVDGSSLRVLRPPDMQPVKGFVCSIADPSCPQFLSFEFEHATPEELAAVVLRVDGRLSVHEVRPTPTARPR